MFSEPEVLVDHPGYCSAEGSGIPGEGAGWECIASTGMVRVSVLAQEVSSSLSEGGAGERVEVLTSRTADLLGEVTA